MDVRSLAAIDDELSRTVKARSSATAQISVLSESIVTLTRQIDLLLAERCTHNACPDTPAALLDGGAVTPPPVGA